MLDIYTISMIAFFGVLGIVIFLDRKNIEFKYVIFIRRTKKGLELLDRIAKFRKFWKAVGIIAIIACFFLMINGLYSLVETSRLIIEGVIKEVPGGLVLPSPTPEAVVGTGFILIPFWFWIIIIPTILFPHEIAHGIISRAEKIKVKSAGLLLLLIFPGAFVEPDEKKLKKAKLMKKLKIFAAGSFANVVFAFFLFNPILQIGLIPNIIWPGIVPGYIQLVEVNSTSPAAQAGLEAGMIITEVNNIPIKVTYSNFISRQYLVKQMEGVEPGNSIEVVANGAKYIVTVGEIVDENRTTTYLGITYTLTTSVDESVFVFIVNLFTWMWILNFAVAIFNILPIYPLDGGLMIEAITEKITRKYYKQIVSLVTIFTIVLVLFTIFGPSIISKLQFF